ncbi:MAG TPA: InlB B-repeat-containing protein, partial [Acidimicrobiales bacterium]|nr:InlB B-repeat-containing protein [Acidimicrobiales bacterium]
TSWNSAANGSGASYALGQSVTLTTSTTLYAQWNSVPEIMLHFVSDGGSGPLTTLSGLLGATVALPGRSSLVKSGYTLKSWNTAANGSGTSYALGQNVTLTTSLTLFARWTGTATAVLYGAVGLFAKNATQLTTAMKSQVRHLAGVIKAKGYKKVSLFGYTAETGLSSLDLSLSRSRAMSVADYLREQLSARKVKGVVILAAGEGSIAKMKAHQYSRVEVFVL